MWKDFFYFSKSERRAILFLLTLLFIFMDIIKFFRIIYRNLPSIRFEIIETRSTFQFKFHIMGVNVETDLNQIPLPDNNVNLEQAELKPSTEPMLHEGLHTEEDFQRIRDKKAAGEEPWVSACLLYTSRCV